MKINLEKQILDSLGLNDTTISFGIDEDIQIQLEHQIDDYLKKIDEEQKKKERLDFVKQEHEKFKRKQELVELLKDKYVFEKIKNMLMYAGFSYQCPTCKPINVSSQYGKPIQEYKSYNKK